MSKKLLMPDAPAVSELEHKFVTLPNGIRACYVEAGPPDAFPLLLTHGFLSSLRDWRYNTAPLAELSTRAGTFQPRRVIALDWIGFGDSDKPDTIYSLRLFSDFLKDFVDTMGLKEFDLCGHSAGGKHNIAFALDYPGYVRKMVLVDTDGFLKDPWWTHITNTWYFKPLANYSTVLLGKPGFLKLSLKNILYDPKFYPSEDEIEQTALKLRDPAYMKVLRSMNRYYPGLSLRLTGRFERLPELTMPVQIFWGLQDKILKVAYGYTAQELLPNAILFIFDKCGHMPQIEKSEEFNRMLLEFLDK